MHAYAKELAQRLAEERPDLVVWQMKKDLRGGKVLIDWSQNNAAKTTVAVYSLRARPDPTVVDADHLGRGRRPAEPRRPGLHRGRRAGPGDDEGDLFADLVASPAALP